MLAAAEYTPSLTANIHSKQWQSAQSQYLAFKCTLFLAMVRITATKQEIMLKCCCMLQLYPYLFIRLENVNVFSTYVIEIEYH
jgi:hypothetical protein